MKSRSQVDFDPVDLQSNGFSFPLFHMGRPPTLENAHFKNSIQLSLLSYIQRSREGFYYPFNHL